MSHTQHTPGPWRIGNSSPLLFGAVRGNGTEPLGFVYGPNAVESSEVYRRAIADAHLIAAAPELYALAEAVMAACEQALIQNTSNEDTAGVLSDFARTALLKARGEA